MTNPALSMRRPVGWASSGERPRPRPPGLLPLLKVRAIHGVVVALLIATQYWLQMAPGLIERPRLLIDLFVGLVGHIVGFWILAFAVIAVVQVKIQPGRARTVGLALFALVWSVLYEAIRGEAETYIVIALGFATPESMAMQGLWADATYLLLAVWYYESADRTSRSIAGLRESELARRGAERWLLELRLGSLQARLDPQVLFDTLDEACRLYRSRPAAAEQLLDALIHYLRRALPQLRQAQSTLDEEVALALAFLRVLRTHDGEPIEIEAAVDPAAKDARFPPMVVQPICDALVRLALAGGEPPRMSMSVMREQGCARVRFGAHPVQAPPSRERLEQVRHTLLTMFGPPARMDVSGPTAGVVHVVVEVPYDAAPRTDS